MYQLTNQPLINRDKVASYQAAASIKHQAVIKVDENGKAFITNLSKTNLPVNGNSIEDIEISYLIWR